MAITVQTILGTECIGDSLPKINDNFSELAAFVAPDFDRVEIENSTHAVNTTNKQIGKVIYNRTNKQLMVAEGQGNTARWYVVDGSTSILPTP